jgi:hypothetical protein
MKLCVVTATTNYEQAQGCIDSWGDVPLVIVQNGRNTVTLNRPEREMQIISSVDYLGTVPAFNLGVQAALEEGYDLIACFHDDLELADPEWAHKVETHFTRHPSCGLAGFGGAIGLGDSNIYQIPYKPDQLARVGFRSNMRDAELHGIRSRLPERVACLDGFSQIGRREFFDGWQLVPDLVGYTVRHTRQQPWQHMVDLGVSHHFYDGMLGCYAKRYGWEVWYLPIACHHYGGRTAVGDRGYQSWAQQQVQGGDHGFWQRAHEIGYSEFRDVLPIRV